MPGAQFFGDIGFRIQAQACVFHVYVNHPVKSDRMVVVPCGVRLDQGNADISVGTHVAFGFYFYGCRSFFGRHPVDFRSNQYTVRTVVLVSVPTERTARKSWVPTNWLAARCITDSSRCLG